MHPSDKATLKKENGKWREKIQTDRWRLFQWERISDDLAGDDITARLKGLLDWLIRVRIWHWRVLAFAVSGPHMIVCVLLVWMIGEVVAFPYRFSPLPALHCKYGLVCLSCLSSPHFFPLFVLLFLFFHPAFCSPSIFSLFLQLCSGSKVFPGEHKGLEQPGFQTQCYFCSVRQPLKSTYNL